MKNLTLLALLTSLATPALAGQEQYVFDVFRNGSKVGQHAVTVDQNGTETRTNVDIDFVITFAYVPVYRYAHDVNVILREGLLHQVSSTTNSNGTPAKVEAIRNGNVVTIEGPNGKLTAEGPILATTYWNPETVKVPQLLDTQNGRIFAIKTTKVAAETVLTKGQNVQADKFEMRGDLNIDLWYTDRGEWVKLAFDLDGDNFDYVRVEPGS